MPLPRSLPLTPAIDALKADSGPDPELYEALSEAPLLLLDARAQGTAEHAGGSHDRSPQENRAGRLGCCDSAGSHGRSGRAAMNTKSQPGPIGE